MSEETRTFTREEVVLLLNEQASIVFDAVSNIFECKSKHEFKENRMHMYRKSLRLSIFPEMVLEELPEPEGYPHETRLSIKNREMFYDLISNHSTDIKSLTDNELIQETLKQLREYK